MTGQSFDNLMLVGRAGSGKSEFIDFLKHIPEAQRCGKYHVGAFDEIDDFPWLLSLFQDEDHWEALGRPRTLSRRVEKIYETVDFGIYDFTTVKFNIEIAKRCITPAYDDRRTLIIEYARGRSDGYRRTLSLFDERVLTQTAIFYLDNTFEESMRRNTVRSSDSDENQTVLFHKCPVGVMENYYKTNDWHALTDKQPKGYVTIKGIRIPFVTVWNIPESHDFAVLEERYSGPLRSLWELYRAR